MLRLAKSRSESPAVAGWTGNWIVTANRHHNDYPDGAACFWTSSVRARMPLLKSATAARCLVRLWDHYRGIYDVRLLGYVIMPEHFHIVVWAGKGESVKRYLKRVLSVSSMELRAMVERAASRGDATAAAWLRVFMSHAGSGSAVAIWQERGRAFPVTSGDLMRQKLIYVHENPVRKGLVERPEDWEFSSAAWYASGSGPLSIDLVDGW